MRWFCYIFWFGFLWGSAHAQCNPFLPAAMSPRVANYTIHAELDHPNKRITATQTIQFLNNSPQAVTHLRMYMYFNSFKNTESTFLKGAANIFGQSYAERRESEWGWLDIQEIKRKGGAPLQTKYVQPDDGNTQDQSVLYVALESPIAPGDSAVFELKWTAQVPKTIARAGYSKDFYLFCHWFPQLGVWEQKPEGNWDWNCHQFFRTTEFFADFGNYDVHITLDKQFVMGASGCLVSEKDAAPGKVTRHYHAEDVIDFAWSIYPRFQVIEDTWKHVHIRVLTPPEHSDMAGRYLSTLKYGFEWLEKHVGRYPYPSMTVIDPPFHGLRSGLMEYPTLITCGTFYGTPNWARNSESLLVHEFVHQYFMGMVASNEKEEAWLDEGFVTYYEDRIIDDLFGAKTSMVNLSDYHFGNRELTRSEYSTMSNPRDGIIGQAGWYFKDTNRKSLIYSKTASTLATMEGHLGVAEMDKFMQSWFEKWKFKHPRGTDFQAHVLAQITAQRDSSTARQILQLVNQSIYQPLALDYALTNIRNEVLQPPQGLYGAPTNHLSHVSGQNGQRCSIIDVSRLGDWQHPVEVLVTFADGSTKTVFWDGQAGSHQFELFDCPDVVSAAIDPEHKILLDLDLNNNSKTLKPDHDPLWRYTLKAIFWLQNLLQSLNFLM
jgi:Peptidase family M1 domain